MKKIMFNDTFGLTEAVLNGSKTMTRRIIPLKNADKEYLESAFDWDLRESVILDQYAKYKVGEIVAVAESYHSLNKKGYLAPEWLDHSCEDSAGYENKMFVNAELMPHHIQMTALKVERLQDITEEDCLKEGVLNNDYGTGFHIHYRTPSGRYLFLAGCNAVRVFSKLINRINGKGTWEQNPWVIAYSFKLMKGDD